MQFYELAGLSAGCITIRPEAFMVAKPYGVADQEHQLLVADAQNSRLDYRNDFLAMQDGTFQLAHSRFKQSLALRACRADWCRERVEFACFH